MNTTLDQNLRAIAPAVVRIGVSLVYLWFGIQQLIDTQVWIAIVPQWTAGLSPFDAATIVHLNGAFEVIFGLALLTGLFTRTSALLLAVHMLPILSSVGYSGMGVRDFGITVATFGVFLYGKDIWSVKITKPTPTTQTQG